MFFHRILSQVILEGHGVTAEKPNPVTSLLDLCYPTSHDMNVQYTLIIHSNEIINIEGKTSNKYLSDLQAQNVYQCDVFFWACRLAIFV